MNIKTYEGKIVEINSIPDEKTLRKIKEIHGDRYEKIYTINGERAKKDFLVECKEHGWFTITKKNFKIGANCKKCAMKLKNEKIKQKRRGNQLVLKKTCPICDSSFEVENLRRVRDRICCSPDCTKVYRYNQLSERNRDPNFIKKVSTSLKLAYKEGRRVSSGGRSNWYDYTTPNGRKKVRGAIELATAKALDQLKSSGRILEWAYEEDSIQYNALNGTQRTYHIDFKVWLTESFFFYIETKGFVIDNDLLKWKSVIKQGYPFKVFMERSHLKKIEEDPEYLLKHEFFSNIQDFYKEKNDFKVFKPNKELL